MTEQIETKPPDISQQDLRLVSVQEAALSPGSPLDPALRALMEARFGHDFGSVRLHTDDLAVASARTLGARAYTVGSHLVFARGQYNPRTREGLWLLAHELSHVIQQGAECATTPLGVAEGNDPLECAADHAADLIVANRELPRGFAFGIARTGVIQCHEGPQCGGWSSLVDDITVLEAERVLELAYQGRPLAPPVEFVAYGSNYLQFPDNVAVDPNLYAFATELRDTILTWPMEERPNILNFSEREAYFFWRFPAPKRAVAIINSFHATESRIGRRYNQPPWVSWNANWFPDHILPFPPDPLERFVCTSMTDHLPPRGLILYDIRQRKKPRRAQRRAMEIRIVDFEQNLAEFGPMIKTWLPKAIEFYDPESPDYVIIVPRQFYTLDYMKEKARMDWRIMTGKAPFFNQIVTTNTIMFAIMGGAQVGMGLVGIIAAAPAAVSTGAVVGTTASASAGMGAGTIEVVVAYEAGATAVGTGATLTGTEAMSVAAYQALLATPTAKAVATMATAGVVLLLGDIKNAQAATSSPSVKPVIGQAVVIRVIPITDFQPLGPKQHAFHQGPPNGFRHTPESAKGKFGLGTEVFYDNSSHWIIGRVSVR
jgi:hypothetical protein